MAKEYFDEWFPAAMKRFAGARFYKSEEHLKDAAFDFHQTVECLYHCVLLTVTFYTPHVHNIGFLRSQAEKPHRRLCYVWPGDMRDDRACFAKLKEAYVKARYSKHYQISITEMNWLEAHINELGRVVQRSSRRPA